MEQTCGSQCLDVLSTNSKAQTSLKSMWKGFFIFNTTYNLDNGQLSKLHELKKTNQQHYLWQVDTTI
jgi:hypothetical protein